jgi:hypothetical protein
MVVGVRITFWWAPELGGLEAAGGAKRAGGRWRDVQGTCVSEPGEFSIEALALRWRFPEELP